MRHERATFTDLLQTPWMFISRRRKCNFLYHTVYGNYILIIIVAMFDVGVFVFIVYGRISIETNCIGGVMVSVLDSSAVARGFEPGSGQTKRL